MCEKIETRTRDIEMKTHHKPMQKTTEISHNHHPGAKHPPPKQRMKSPLRLIENKRKENSSTNCNRHNSLPLRPTIQTPTPSQPNKNSPRTQKGHSSTGPIQDP